LLIVAAILGVVGYRLIEGWSLRDSIYMTLMVLTTVGFGEVHAIGPGGVWFTVALMIVGVGVFLLALALTAQAIAEGGLGEAARRRRVQRKIDRMEGHVIVCAYGRVGRAVARELEVEGAAYVAVDAKEELEDQMASEGIPYIIGDPTNEPVLRNAGIERARCLVCCVDSDAANVYITLAARSLNPDIFIVARAAERASAERLYRAGANRVVSPYASSGRHMALLALRPRVVDFFEVATRDQADRTQPAGASTSVRLEEIEVEPGSGLVGKPLESACGEATPLVLRSADGRVDAHPTGSVILSPGDLIVVLGEQDELRSVEGKPTREP
jgi:voltage-gated potassium channel